MGIFKINYIKVIINITREILRIIKREIAYHRVRPSYALAYLTFRCTARCQSCSMWKRGKKADASKEMSLDEWKNCIDMISKKNIEVVELFGGDALLRKDILLPLINYISSKNIHPHLTINGNLLDKETAIQLASSELRDLYISIDAIGKVHDELRGCAGIYDKAVQGIKYVIEARGEKKIPEVICNTTISSSNLDHIKDVVLLAKKLGMDSVHLEYVGAISKENINNTNIDGLVPEPYFVSAESPYLNEEQAKLLKEKISNIKKMSKKLRFNISTKNIDMLTIDDIINGKFPNKKCYMCRYMISVDPYGNITPCPFFSNYIIGNLRREDFDSVWNNKKHKEFMKHQSKKRLYICENCILGVQRNITFLQSFVRLYFKLTKKEKM